MYKQSKYNVFVPLKNGDTLAYNAVSGALAVWDAEDMRVYREYGGMSGGGTQAGRITESLIKGAYLVGCGVDESRKIMESFTMNRHNRSCMTLTIAPTLACNFACDYCYQGSSLDQTPMTAEIKSRLCAMIRRRTKHLNRLHVAWYGGEPLLAKRAVYGLSSRIRKVCADNGAAYTSFMVTNGYHLDEDTANRLLEQEVRQVQITLDGGRDTHDSRRHLKNGGKTYERIVANIERAVCNTPLTVTVRVNIDKRNMDSIDGLLHDLCCRGLAGRNNFSVYFAPVDVCSDECLRVTGEVLPLAEYGRIEYALMQTAIRLKLASAALPGALRSMCAAIKPNGFVVLPNGDMHKCWNTVSDRKKRVCTLDELDGVEGAPLQKEWLAWSPFSLEECPDCPLLPSCAGGCAHRSGGRGACISLRHNIRERLALYAAANNVIALDDAVIQ